MVTPIYLTSPVKVLLWLVPTGVVVVLIAKSSFLCISMARKAISIAMASNCIFVGVTNTPEDQDQERTARFERGKNKRTKREIFFALIGHLK